jgi:Tfp pilus assembly protein PilN
VVSLAFRAREFDRILARIYLTVITKLNLATRPFRNRTTPYLLSLLFLALAVSGGLLCFSQLNRAASQNEIARHDIEQMNEQIKELKAKGEAVKLSLTPEQLNLLVQSHKLVANKTFGWSRLFADLEGVLPGSVSASRISVENVYKDGDRIKAELNFSVLSRDYQGIMAMISNMNNSGLFQTELRGQDRQENERGTFTEYTFHLIYTPAYGYAVSSSSEVAQGGQAQQ